MRRRKRQEEHVNHERWLVSYADFITLLFAFFVVMYSISQVNEGKYRVLSSTLTHVFNRQGSLSPIELGAGGASTPAVPTPVELPIVRPVLAPDELARDDASTTFRAITARLEAQLSDLLARELVVMRGNEEWLEIDLRSSLLFDSGDAELSNGALTVLGRIATILRGHGYAVRVEGFTDNRPISTSRFPSNWALSAARAAAVVQLFIEEGIPPFQLMAAGYGEFQPVADNGTAEGRARNRRVVLMVAKNGRLRPELPALAPADTAAASEH